MQKLIQVLKQLGVQDKAVVKERAVLNIEKRPEIAHVKHVGVAYVDAIISRQIGYKQFTQIEQAVDSKRIIFSGVERQPITGYPFANYGEVNHVLNEITTELKHLPGEVLLLAFWSCTCDDSLSFMQLSADLLQKNENWAQKVRFAAIGIGKKKELYVQKLKEKKWDKMVHLNIHLWDVENLVIQEFVPQDVPRLCLVDKFGKINFFGEPSKINLEEKVNQLLAQDKEEVYVAEEEEPAGLVADYQQTYDKVQAEITADKVKELFEDSTLLCMRKTIVSRYQKGVCRKKFVLDTNVHEGDLEIIQRLKNLYGTIAHLQLKINEIKHVEVPYEENALCWDCKAELKFPYYWLKWEEGAKFGCKQCVQKASTVAGHHFNYEKNSVLLPAKWKRIAAKDFGLNLQPQDIAEFKQDHQFSCNSCSQCSALGQARYVCLGCRADPNFNWDKIDFCEKCMEKMLLGDEETKKCFENELHSDSHPWLRILYKAKNYLEY